MSNRAGGSDVAVSDGRGREPRKENHLMVNRIFAKAFLALESLKDDREEGQALVEYALILSLIAVVAIGMLTLLGKNISTILSTIANKI
jgi:pilus assembly protein Flp/PilA